MEANEAAQATLFARRRRRGRSDAPPAYNDLFPADRWHVHFTIYYLFTFLQLKLWHWLINRYNPRYWSALNSICSFLRICLQRYLFSFADEPKSKQVSLFFRGGWKLRIFSAQFLGQFLRLSHVHVLLSFEYSTSQSLVCLQLLPDNLKTKFWE